MMIVVEMRSYLLSIMSGRWSSEWEEKEWEEMQENLKKCKTAAGADDVVSSRLTQLKDCFNQLSTGESWYSLEMKNPHHLMIIMTMISISSCDSYYDLWRFSSSSHFNISLNI